MIVDTSAIIAILRNEAEAERIEAALLSAPILRMSSFTLLECKVVILRQASDAMLRECELLLSKLNVKIEPFDQDQATIAFDAYERFGKGTGHRAQLNLGDCVAYALATSHREPLLFVGKDFSRTDVAIAI